MTSNVFIFAAGIVQANMPLFSTHYATVDKKENWASFGQLWNAICKWKYLRLTRVSCPL